MTTLAFHPSQVVASGEAYLSIALQDWDVGGDYPNAVALFGWTMAPGVAEAEMEIYIRGCRAMTVKPYIPRPDVCAAHPGLGVPEVTGFHFRLSKFILPPDGRVDVALAWREANGEKVEKPLGWLEFSDARSAPVGYRERARPLIVAGLGRSGSSALMNCLAHHPGIVVAGGPPHELRAAAWLWQAAHVLSAPWIAESVSPDSLETKVPHALGYNPFRALDWEKGSRAPEFVAWQQRALPLAMIDQIKRCVDEMVAALRPDEAIDGLYLGQKMNVATLLQFIENIYGSVRIVLLVRDFRDVWLSARAFNARRGTRSFGAERFDDDLEWLRDHARPANKLKIFHATAGLNLRLVKFEDFVSAPKPTLRGLFDWLELDADDATVTTLLAQSEAATATFRDSHRTHVGLEVARWRREMNAAERAISRELYADALRHFGYDLE